jgi:HEAT repeat protein
MPAVGASLAFALALILVMPAPRAQGRVAELTTQLTAEDAAVRARAACELREFGGAATPALDALVALLADGAPLAQPVCGRNWWRGNHASLTSPGEQAAATLVAIGTPAFKPLMDSLRSPSWIARRHAAWALGALEDHRAVDPLMDLLDDREAGVREQVCWALGALGDERALHRLLPSLKDPDARVRRQAAWAIGVLHNSARRSESR